MKYYQLLDANTLEVFVSQDLENKPENSIEFFANDFKKCGFDKYPNPTTVIELISEIELIEQSLYNETQKYIQRTTDGVNAYAKISAEFRLAKLSGTIDDATHTYLENLLIPIRNEVLAGQWISAKQKLIVIGVAQVGEVLYNRLFDQITNYIELNY
jgi:hypothetical protein